MKTIENITCKHEAVKAIHELKEWALFYLHRYRFDPFMRQEHEAQLKKLDELLKQLKDND